MAGEVAIKGVSQGVGDGSEGGEEAGEAKDVGAKVVSEEVGVREAAELFGNGSDFKGDEEECAAQTDEGCDDG